MIQCKITNKCPDYAVNCDVCSRNSNNKDSKKMLLDMYKQGDNKNKEGK